jgi:hypothetical protein
VPAPNRAIVANRALLAFAAEHQIVDADQVAVLLGTTVRTASDRLRRLVGARLIAREERDGYRRPGTYRITRAGLDAIGRRGQRPPRASARSQLHDIGLGWLWLAARAGSFGPLRGTVSERQMRSHDGTEDGRGEPFGVRMRAGQDGLHYPDLLLVTVAGKRIALELELTGKDRPRREKILAAYAVDPRIDGVVYLAEVNKPWIARGIQASARRLGISDLIHVRQVRWGDRPAERQPSARVLERSREPHRDVAEASL